MKAISNSFLKRIESEEKLKILNELQVQHASQYSFLSMPTLYTIKYRTLLEKFGAILFSLLVAVFVITANYLIFVEVLHFIL
jgi:hypothetical protein